MIRASLTVCLLLLALQAISLVKANSGGNLVRKRREWILPPKPLTENVDYTHLKFISKIRSDFEDEGIEYSLEGAGASQEPYHVFVVDPKTGFIRVTKLLDREYVHMYNLSGIAKRKDGSEAEKRIDIRIVVVDQNDNSPVFEITPPVDVFELSASGTSVMKITATDADEEGNPNSQIAYSIIDQKPAHDMFYIERDGTVHVKRGSLDRETQAQYTLTVKGQDLNGEPGGRVGTGTVTINVLDVNDNPPTLEKEKYEGSIEENTKDVEVMRIKTEDLDLKGTDNWEAVFDIVTGNEAGYFSITTDPKTNEGILRLDKAVNYEDVKNLQLGLSVRNKAPLYDGSGASAPFGIGVDAVNEATGANAVDGWGYSSSHGGSSSSGTKLKTYPITITVKNQPEGPVFDPKVKAIPVSEGDDIDITKFITHYPALDEDTGKPAENVRYVKGSDPDNWLIIDQKTAEIKLNKKPDRESEFLVNGTYFAKVLCITEDMPAKTATGTIAIQVEDSNDHCPKLTSTITDMCTTASSVTVNAVDEDVFPNGPPFRFAVIPEGTKGKWHVEHLNDTAATLRADEPVWPGLYEVQVEVKDWQGKACPEPQSLTVQVCTCVDGVACGSQDANGQITKSSQLGPAGIGLLFLGLLLLLLLLLLALVCQCGNIIPGGPGFIKMPYDTNSHLVNYHTEGQGDNTDIPIINVPTQVISQGMARDTLGLAPYQTSFTSVDGMNGAMYQGEISQGLMSHVNGSAFYSEFEGRGSAAGGRFYDGMALPDHFLEEYYSQKVASGNENSAVKDALLIYDYEGQGSAVGSVDCCSLLESDYDLQFLDDLGPKFNTLAEVCGGKISTVASASINTQSSMSAMVTAPELPPLPKLQPTIPKTVQTVVRETSEHSQMMKEDVASVRKEMTTVKEGKTNQGQMLLLQQQQPVYYTTTTAPVLQPMQYVVQPQVQNTILLAEAPTTNLQGMVLVNGVQTGPAQGAVVQGQTVMSSVQAQGPGLMLVESNRIQGGSGNLIHTGNLSGSQPMLVTEGKVTGGSTKVLKGSQTHLVQGGTLQSGGLSGSQRVLVVGGPVSSGGQLVQEAGGLSQMSTSSQTVLFSKGSTSTESQSSIVGSSTTTASRIPTYHKVVVQKTKEIH